MRCCLKPIVSAIIKNLEPITTRAVPFIKSLADTIKDSIPLIGQKLKETAVNAALFVKDFVELGGVGAVIEIVVNAFLGLVKIIKIAVKSFKSVFPPINITAESVYKLVDGIRNMTRSFVDSEKSTKQLTAIFTSLFKFAKTIIKTVARVSKSLLNLAVSSLPTLINAFSSGIGVYGDFITMIASIAVQVLPLLISVLGSAVSVISSFASQAISLGGQILPTFISFISKAANAIASFIKSFIAAGGLTAAANTLKNIFNAVAKAVGIFSQTISDIFPSNGSIVSVIINVISAIGDLASAFINSDESAQILSTAIKAVFSIFDKGSKIVIKLADSLFDVVKSVLPLFADIIGKLLSKIGSGELDTVIINFTDALISLIPTLVKSAGKVTDFIKDFSELGGFTSLGNIIKNSFNIVIDMIGLAHKAYLDIFPASSLDSAANPIMDLIKGFERLTDNMLNNEEVSDKLLRIFRGMFAAVDILKTVISALLSPVSSLDGGVSSVIDVLLEALATVGDFIVWLDNAIKSSQGFDTALDKPVDMLKGFAGAIISVINTGKELFNYIGESTGLFDIFTSFTQSAKDGFTGFGDLFGQIFDAVAEKAQSIWQEISPIFISIRNFVTSILDGLGSSLSSFLGGINLGTIFDLLDAGSLLALAIGINKLADSLSNLFENGILGGIKSVIDGVRDSLESWQKLMASGIIKNIAISLGILAIALIGLSTLDEEALTSALGGITVMLTELIIGLGIFLKIIKNTGLEAETISTAAKTFLSLSVSMLLLTSVLKTLSKMNWDELAKGLGGIGIMLAELSLFINKTKIKRISTETGLGLLALAASISILSTAVAFLGVLPLDVWLQGIGGVALLLGELMLFVNNIKQKDIINTALGLGVLGIALQTFVSSVALLGLLNIDAWAKGLGAIGVLLLSTGLFVSYVKPQNIIQTAIGIGVLGVAMSAYVKAVSDFGSMDIEVIKQGLLSLAAVLAGLWAFISFVKPTSFISTAIGVGILGAALL